MPRPRLTFFVELPTPALGALFADAEVARFLERGGHSVSMGLIDLTVERAAVVRDLESRGVAVTAWLLLDVAQGYWLNADNPTAARARFHETRAWAEREGLRLQRIGLDIEFPRADADMLMRNPRQGLWTLFRRRRSRQAVEGAEDAYRQLVEEIRAGGRSVETYHFPHILDERRAGSALLRRSFGLVDVPADAEVYMLYASYLGRSGSRAYFEDAPCIALGVTGGGVNAGRPEEVARLLSWERLEEDLLAAAAHSREVYVFSLEGCVERRMLERIDAVDWNGVAPQLTAAEARRARRGRRIVRAILRSEPIWDLVLPSRR